ncbi:MAG: peptidylprolyl isomerase [Syntrophothermus sp.]
MLRHLFLYLSFPCLMLAQPAERIVAGIGKSNIFESEFIERFNFSVHPYLKNKNDRKQAKLEYLRQLIAEKLLANEARLKGYDTLDIFNSIIGPLQNMYLRDALYKFEIKNKVKISEKEIEEGILRSRKTLGLKFFYSAGEDEINAVYSKLRHGASFDSLLLSRKEAKDQTAEREVTFGTMDKEAEDIIYKLKAGEYSVPVKSKDGFYILKVVSIKDNPQTKDPADMLEEIKKIVSLRSEYSEYLKYTRAFFSPNKISAGREIFEALASLFTAAINGKYISADYIADAGKITLMGREVTSAYNRLPDKLKSKVFISLPGKEVKVKYFLNQLAQEGFRTEDKSELKVRSSLSAYIRKFIQDELLTLSADKKGMKNLPGVKRYLSMWQDSYLSKMLMMDIFDSLKVSAGEALEIYKRSGGNPFTIEKVNIAEILTDSLAVVEHLLKEISEGKDFTELASRYTQRDSLKSRGGEFGFFPVTRHGELGRIASRMKIGQIYGPVKTNEGYSVIKLLERKDEKVNGPQNFEDVKDQIIMKVSAARFEEHINKYTADLARKYGVYINEKTLDDIENIYLNLVVVRYMGFGGEIFAVPYTEQFTGWYDLYIKNKEREL